jgi:DNA repair photolyase
MKLEFQEYQPRKIINVHKHVDGPWFWGKYTTHPYVGCRSGCEFCYSRGGRYLGRRDPDTFDTLIQVKINAVELLRKELPRLDPEVISVGDWQQPAEDRYQLSRQMLEVVREHAFPLFIVERSPLLTRDIDLLTEINQQTWVGVLFSISSMDPTLKRAFEPRSPGVKRRLLAMEKLAYSGIQVGTSMMPIFPHVGDSQEHLEELIRATKDHGGTCVLAGGLTMDGAQAERTLIAARLLDPTLEKRWRAFYNWKPNVKPNYGPPRAYNARLGLLVRELCERHGLLDRMPRYIPPGSLAINKRIAEKLFLRTYDLELEQASDQRIWAYRRAAWTVDELPESIENIFKAQGEAGLRALPGIGTRLAGLITRWLREETSLGTTRDA